VPYLGVVDKTRHNLQELGFRQFTRLFADADFIPIRSFSTAVDFSPRFRIASCLLSRNFFINV
jgi:hypothetical protein